MLRIIHTGLYPDPILEEEWRRRGCLVEFIPLAGLVDNLREEDAISADCFVCVADEELRLDDGAFRGLPLGAAVRLADEIGSLNDRCAMPDGRKWKSVPFIILLRGESWRSPGSALNGERVFVLQDFGPKATLEMVKAIVADYRRKLLDELDNLGLLVSYEGGRYQVGHVFSERLGHEGRFYYAPADERRRAPNRLFTIDRDNYGVQREIEQLEALINDPETTEPQLQRFFEENPDFLPMQSLVSALPHVSLRTPAGRLLVPDFVLRPVVAARRCRDQNWEVLDLKRPQVKLLARTRDRARFSSDVNNALAQLRDYRDYFGDPANTDNVEAILGAKLRFPRLAVLIGRLPSGEELAALNKQQQEIDVRVVTYDEVLEQKKQMLEK